MTQPTYAPQAGPNEEQPPFTGQSAPNYQQFARYYGQPQQTFGPTRVALPYQYYNYPQLNQQLLFFLPWIYQTYPS